MSWGGKREGSGRKSLHGKTSVVRVPDKYIPILNKIINGEVIVNEGEVMKVEKVVFTDNTGYTHKVKIVRNTGKGMLFSADDILIMLGYSSYYSAAKDHNFVNGLRNKSSRLSTLPFTLVDEVFKYWTRADIATYSEMASEYDGKWDVLDAFLKFISISELPEVGVTVHTVEHDASDGDWYEDGELPPLNTECEYSVNDAPYRWCKLNYIGKNIVVFETKTSSEVVAEVETVDFRPLDLEKKQVVAGMMKLSTGGMSLHDFATKLYENNYRVVEV